ncbi:MAG: acyltransferase [Eubacteriales bacterium]|nr:acyltransferase [Eubacteriales bacterium]
MQRNREFGADLVRVVATFFIIGVHFFLYSDFYSVSQEEILFVLAGFVRWITFACVPLFLVLTGYLKGKAKWTPQYYRSLVPILVTWLLMSVIGIAFSIGYLHVEHTFGEWLVELFEYRASKYAWYIELYIVLFLLAPFLNEVFRGQQNKSFHKGLLVTFFVVTILPSITNFYSVGDERLRILPDYMVLLWPITYYYVGCYIAMYKPNPKKRNCIAVAVVAALCQSVVTYIHSSGDSFDDLLKAGYADLFTFVITIAVFLMLYSVNTKKTKVRQVVTHISKRSLHIYLVSSIFDMLIWNDGAGMAVFDEYWWKFPVKCMGVFIAALLTSEITYPISQAIAKLVLQLVSKEKSK